MIWKLLSMVLLMLLVITGGVLFYVGKDMMEVEKSLEIQNATQQGFISGRNFIILQINQNGRIPVIINNGTDVKWIPIQQLCQERA